MFDSTSVITDHALPVSRRRVGFIALWGEQVALAGMFLLSGGSKLQAPPRCWHCSMRSA